MDRISITALSFLDYALGGQRGRIQVVAAQRSIYLAEQFLGRAFYQPVRHAMREAAAAGDAARPLTAVRQRARQHGQARAFAEIAEGYLPWLRRQRAIGMPVGYTKLRVGSLDLSVRPDLGLRLRDGSALAVLAYLKERPLTREVATIGLRILQQSLPDVLPGARPLVLDARRGKSFTLSSRTNVRSVDALIAGEAAGYAVHWRLAA